MTPEEQKEQNKKIAIWTVSISIAVGFTTFLVTSLILNKKYAKLEAQYWGM